MRVAFVILASLCLWVPAVSAQSVADPTTVEFFPSADHYGTNPEGHPLVTSYELRLYYAATGEPWGIHDLGKPEPGTDGLIRVTDPAWFVPPILEEVCIAVVAAIGPGGTSVSEWSNTFYQSTGQRDPPVAVTTILLIRGE